MQNGCARQSGRWKRRRALNDPTSHTGRARIHAFESGDEFGGTELLDSVSEVPYVFCRDPRAQLPKPLLLGNDHDAALPIDVKVPIAKRLGDLHLCVLPGKEAQENCDWNCVLVRKLYRPVVVPEDEALALGKVPQREGRSQRGLVEDLLWPKEVTEQMQQCAPTRVGRANEHWNPAGLRRPVLQAGFEQSCKFMLRQRRCILPEDFRRGGRTGAKPRSSRTRSLCDYHHYT